jgi:hypothetical protein
MGCLDVLQFIVAGAAIAMMIKENFTTIKDGKKLAGGARSNVIVKFHS